MVFNGAQFHMLVNHLPVVGFIGIVLALLVTLKVKSPDVRRFVLMATVLVGLTALPSLWTGEPAEEVIEDLPGISKKLIHEHEELAEKATILAVFTAGVAALALVLQRRRPETMDKSIPAVFVFSLATAGLMGWVAHEGGLIRHPEINPDAAATPASDAVSKDGETENHLGKEHEGG
ncbi:MAG TPA: hypothetical protein VFO10_21785 [Oligoflexus sp.]|uniref:hypothetical protein n=1 Tax=Oligoflexus sp. TaxID=1971216 RepID=UPI002D8101C0|nr:hypothetical protein [Oligoflexus sp.]HET9239908.1 hypothetical protein [Oligoflexus sp.]